MAEIWVVEKVITSPLWDCHEPTSADFCVDVIIKRKIKSESRSFFISLYMVSLFFDGWWTWVCFVERWEGVVHFVARQNEPKTRLKGGSMPPFKDSLLQKWLCPF